MTIDGNNSGTWYSFNGNNKGDYIWSHFVEDNGWHRVDMYARISTPDVADGVHGFWLDLETVEYDETYMTVSSSAASDSFNVFVLPFYVAHDPGGPHRIYYDDVYIDNTLARVELGDNEIWENCMHREIQIPSTWSNDSITINLNAGAFNYGKPTYLYVVDAEGNVNDRGFPISLASIGDGVSEGAAGCFITTMANGSAHRR